MNSKTNTPIEYIQNPYAPPTSNIEIAQPSGDRHARLFAREGRLGRMQYLVYNFRAYVLMYGLVIAAAAIGEILGNGGFDVLVMLVAIVALVIGFGLTLYLTRRRLHDMNASGWWMILMFIPYLNFVFVLVLLTFSGTRGVNSYGAPPPPNNLAVKIACAMLVILFLALVLFAILS